MADSLHACSADRAAAEVSAPGGAPSGRATVGVGWRQPHEAALRTPRPGLGFIEVHSENFFADGGAALATLLAARADHAISLHGVGLGLGSACGLDAWHLDQLARLVERVDPVRVSDHAAFARAPVAAGGTPVHGSDLLPVAFSEAALALMVRHVQQVQERLRRPLLVENLSSYVRWAEPEMDEASFFNRLARHSGCALLLDVNNLVVNARNDLAGPGGAETAAPDAVLASVCGVIDRLDPGIVGQVHLAGHTVVDGLAIDDHGSRVPPLVWRAFAHAVARCGAVPTLIEWDTDLPPFEVLLGEAAEAARVIEQTLAATRGHGDGR